MGDLARALSTCTLISNPQTNRPPTMQEPILLDGKRTAETVITELASDVAQNTGSKIILATVLVGNYPPSQIYVKLKLKMAARAGLKPRLIKLPENTSQKEVENTIQELANDTTVHGILLQLPLPKHLDVASILELIPPLKDVDGLTANNLGCLLNNTDGLLPCTPLGVMELIKRYDIPTRGRTAAVIGRSHLVGLPLSLLLGRKGTDCTVTICHSATKNLAQICQQAEILVAACGVPKLITREYVKPGAAVFDVGITRKEGKICGDVLFDDVAEIAGAITPMPGGTGPMTVACLIKNTIRAATMQKQRHLPS